ncbi:hypothetical protein [Haloarchaeobius sp. DT45]|uniref:hypothetical protein n=1 Tax=Haloarchaeobius sp. DT45 TaxID=3446116 RepID=UPI003F6D4A3C
MSGRVPFVFPLSVPQGEIDRLAQSVDDDGTIERLVVFFPEGTRTDLRVTPTVDGNSLLEADATESSGSIGDYIIGSGATYDFDLSMPVYEGQDLGVTADNTSPSSDLDGFVSFTVDYAGGAR